MGRHGNALYVVFEGCETSGKSTQTVRAAERFEGIITRETGGTATGQRIRQILHDISLSNLLPQTEAFLTAADRSQHIHEVVAPAINAGRDVFSDRSWVGSLVYQGLAGGADPELIIHLTELAIGAYKDPDLLFLIDLPFEEYERRQAAKGITDRFEAKEKAFHRKVLEGYREIAQDLGAVVLDGQKTIEVIAHEVVETVKAKKQEEA